jgi:oligopeptide/dipeptide ABC transporter ATP-binding protein
VSGQHTSPGAGTPRHDPAHGAAAIGGAGQEGKQAAGARPPAPAAAHTSTPLLRAAGVNVVYRPSRGAAVWSVRDVSLELGEGEFVGLVGESGCGKSTLGFALTRMLKPPARFEGGQIWFAGEDISRLENEALRVRRRGGFALVLQSGMNALNPVRRVEDQFADVMRAFGRTPAPQVRRRAAELLEKVRLPRTTLTRYPHELSGGMRQRVAIALALTLEPRLVVFDEPTTALDVIAQEAVLRTISDLQRDTGFTALLISHDLGVVLEATERVLVMYGGRIVEDRPAHGILTDARHPYTQALLRCYADPRADEVKLEGIPGTPPDLSAPPGGCSFVPRCPLAERVCIDRDPDLLAVGGGLAACHVAQRATSSGQPAEASHAR